MWEWRGVAVIVSADERESRPVGAEKKSGLHDECGFLYKVSGGVCCDFRVTAFTPVLDAAACSRRASSLDSVGNESALWLFL